MTASYRLADSTVVEPLINHWAIWADLLSPAPYSMHMSNYQIPTLVSYLENPELHIKASRNPKLIGGPFVDIPQERKGEVQTLLEKSRTEQAANIEFAKAIVEFSSFLQKEANGPSLEPLYGKLPPALRGYVELLYDYHNHPILRILESFVYRSRYYNDQLQSLRLFRPARDDSRRFFLSTPHLPTETDLDWRLPFADARIDDLFRLEKNPRPLEHRHDAGLCPPGSGFFGRGDGAGPVLVAGRGPSAARRRRQ